MIIIGEKINGAIPSVATAIANRDEASQTEDPVLETQPGVPGALPGISPGHENPSGYLRPVL